MTIPVMPSRNEIGMAPTVCTMFRVSNTPGNPGILLEFFFTSWKSTGILICLLEFQTFSVECHEKDHQLNHQTS
jgi:hypothetical protein